MQNCVFCTHSTQSGQRFSLLEATKQVNQNGTTSSYRLLINSLMSIWNSWKGRKMAKKKFAELRAKMSAESLARSHEKADVYRADMALDELREAMNLTQEHLANTLGVKQAAISKMERRT